MPFDLVIFDCDGVLVDSEPISNRILCDMINQIGLAYSYDQTTAAFKGRSMAACYEIIESELRQPLPSDFDQTFRNRTFVAFTQELRPIAGVHDVLAGLSIPACVASSGPHEKIRHNLTLTGLMTRFEGRIFSAADVARGKPAPDLFLHAAATLKVPADRCAVVEDSPLGVRAGVAAGMTVFGFVADSDPEELRAEGATVFTAMPHLPALLAGG